MSMLSYLILAQHKALLQEHIGTLLQQHSITKNHVYIFAADTPVPPIDEIRRIRLLASSQFSQPTAFIIWNLDGANELTQNTLLKILEEHPDNLLFMFPITSEVAIIPTILSRLVVKRISSADTAALASVYAQKWQQLIDNHHYALASTCIGVENKKSDDIVPVIHDFLQYGYTQIKEQNSPHHTTLFLTKALYALRLIREQNMDAEMALNSIFL